MTGEAQGSEDSIQSFLKEINSGPSAAHVVKVEKEEIKMKVRTLQFDVTLRGRDEWRFETILTANYD